MIPLPGSPKIIKKEKNKAIFEIEGLYPGYGVTLANSLRRVLLSSLPGAAVTQVKIKGAPHEFSVLPGVLEDMITIMLNLKQLRFKLFSAEPQTGTVKVKGEKEIKGSDIKLPSQAELVNKDCHIATLTSKTAELEMEILIEGGIGYSPREGRKKAADPQEKTAIGVILVDAIFSPIMRVSFKVENMRVGERTDFDRILLELETDGTISPEKAFYEASDTLVKHFALFSETFAVFPEGEPDKGQGAEKKEPAKLAGKKKKSKEEKYEKKKKRKKA